MAGILGISPMFVPRPASPVLPDNVLPIRGSRTATVTVVPTIPQKELRNQVGEILRRAEAGEEFTITVSGRPVARLGPIPFEAGREDDADAWVNSADLTDLMGLPAMPDFLEDIRGGFVGEVRDPWESQS